MLEIILNYSVWAVLGTLYGFIFGIIPVAGATTALLTVFGFVHVFSADPYSLVVFTIALVIATSTGDLFSSVVMNIPGGGGSAATMVDGYPMARRGEAARAMAAAIGSASFQGVFWGILAIAFLPFYGDLILAFATPEMFAFLILAMATCTFIGNKYWFRGIIGLCLGIFLGLIGLDPVTNAERWTFGWYYLANGIQFAPLMAGVLALPELWEAIRKKVTYLESPTNNTRQIKQGLLDVWRNKRDSFEGGAIGAFIGALPAMGSQIGEWLTYNRVVSRNQNQEIPFGEGNVKGIIAPEGANLAHKSTSYVPTVLFGVPGAPLQVLVIALLSIVGLDLGSVSLLQDSKFYDLLSFGYAVSLVLAFIIGIIFIRYATLITKVPVAYWTVPTMLLIVWSCVQYTGQWEDYAILAICALIGLTLKLTKISRISFIMGFALSSKIELVGLQFFTMYHITDILTRPISMTLLFFTIVIIVRGLLFSSKSKITYV